MTTKTLRLDQLDPELRKDIAYTFDFVNRGLYREAIESSAAALLKLANLFQYPCEELPPYLVGSKSTGVDLLAWEENTANLRAEREFIETIKGQYQSQQTDWRPLLSSITLTPPLNEILAEGMTKTTAIFRAKAFIAECEWIYARVLLSRLWVADPSDKEVTELLEGLHRFHPSQFCELGSVTSTKDIPFSNPPASFSARSKTRPLEWGSISNARILGKEALIQLQTGKLLKPGQHSPYPGALRDPILSPPDTTYMQTHSQVCPLIGIGAVNFFHWMVEQLPRALFAEQMGYTGKYVVPVSGAFIAETLALIGINPDRLVPYDGKQAVAVEEMLFIEPFSREFVVPYEALYKALSERICTTIAKQPLAPETVLPKRIYISRSIERVVRNEFELLPLLERFNVVPFNFDHLTLSDQIRLMSQTEFVLGPHGAALTHALFMPRGSTLVEMFSPNFVNHCFLGLTQLRGVRYREATAYNGNRHYPYGDDIAAPLELLELYLLEQFNE